MKRQTWKFKINNFAGVCILFIIVSIAFIMVVFKIKLYSLDSETMQPLLSKGSLLVNRKTEFEKINVDDIVTYKVENGSIYVSEKVEEIIDENTLQVTSIQNDSPVKIIKSQIQSKMLFHIPYLGTILLFLQNKGKWILVACILLFTIKIILDVKVQKKARI